MSVSFSCPVCRVAVVPNSPRCRACGARLSPDGGAAPFCDAPPIWMTPPQHARLEAVARAHRRAAPAICDFLLGELNRAALCEPEAIAPDVVTMNSRVAFVADGADRAEARVLVYPERYVPDGASVSILSPLGAALIGLAAGGSMPFTDRDGGFRSVRVERVAFQPEAEGRARRAQREKPPAA